MTTERDERVMGLMELALSIDEDQRSAYLREACQGDEALFTEILDRLDWDKRMDGFLLEPLIPRTQMEKPFQPGEEIGGRYVIQREVAEGGMAVVYEAYDRKLEGPVALKCPKPGHSRRLPPEIRAAMQVTHRNVCRLNSIESVRTAKGEVEFLTMEFLAGETLAERLRRERVPASEAEAIAAQLCAGLGEAHKRNVVHGDLKPSNVILTKDEGATPRAVIMDFGLAQPANGAVGSGSFGSGRLRGTRDFIAPERWLGERASIKSDIYALGVMLYELACGARPFTDENIEQRMKAAPPPPSKVAKGVSPGLERAAMRCLQPDPAKRPASSEEVSALLRPQRSAWFGYAAIAAVVLLALAGWMMRPTNTAPLRIAVLDLKTSPDAAIYARGIMVDVSNRLERLATAKINRMVVISVADTARNGKLEPENAAQKLGATHVLSGTLRLMNGKLRLTPQLRDAAGNHMLDLDSREFTTAQLGGLPIALTGAISNALRLKSVPQPDPVRQEAYPDYTRALELISRGSDPKGAIDLLSKVIAVDSASSLPFAALAEAQIQLAKKTGNQQLLEAAKTSAEEATRRNPDSPEALLVAGTIKDSAGAYADAIHDFERVAELAPSNAEPLRRMAFAYEHAKDRLNAIRFYQAAIQVQPEYYRNYLYLGNYYFSQSNMDEAERQFQMVIKTAPGVREGHHSLARLYNETGRFNEAEAEFVEANRILEQSDSYIGIGSVRAYQKRHHESVGYYEKAAKLSRPSALLLSNLADAYRRDGNQNQALATYRQALELVTEDLRRNPADSYVRAIRAYINARLGNRAPALDDIGQARSTALSNRDTITRAILTYECLGLRPQALELVRLSPPALVSKLKRQPDLSDLQADTRFIEMSSERN